MSLHEGEENQPSSYHMLEVPLEAVAVGKGVDNKDIEKEEDSSWCSKSPKEKQKVNRDRSEFEAVNSGQYKKKDELHISLTIWNNRRLDVLIKELCDSGRGISTVWLYLNKCY